MNTPNPDSNPRLVLDSAPALIHTGLPDGYLDFFNQTWLTYVGRSLEDLQGWKWTASIHPDDLHAMLQAWRTALASGEPFLHEARVRRADGEYRWMLHHKIALRDEHGNVVKWYGSSIDIEDRKRAEEALRENEQRFRTLVDHATDAFGLVDERGIIVDVNREACESRGYRREEMIGMSVSEIDPDVDLDAIQKRFAAGEQVVTFESRNRRKDGTLFPVEVRTRRFLSPEGRVFSLTLGRDITERKRAEEKAGQQERKLREILDLVPHHIVVVAADGTRLYSNQALLDYYALTAEDLRRSVTDTREMARRIAHPEDVETYVAAWERGIAGTVPWETEGRFRRGDGQYRWFLIRSIPLHDDEGRIVHWYITGTDIDDRKKAEETLRESEERYRALLEVSPQMVWTTPADGWTIFANQWWYEYTGLTDPATQGFEPIHPEHRPRMWKSWRQTVESGREWIEEAPLRRAADGQYRWHLLRGRPMRDADGRIVRWIGIAIDIHDRREAEEALRESEEHYRALIEVSPQMVWVTRADGSNTYFNQWWYDYTELTQAESEGFGWAQVVHPEHRDRTTEMWRQHVASGTEFSIETPLRRGDGQYRWHLGRGLPIRDADGRIVRWMGINIDIHDRREAEESLRRTEAWLSEAQRLSHTGSWAMNRETRQVVYASKEFLRITGFDEGEGIPSTEEVFGRIHPDDRPGAIEDLERGLRETTDYTGVRRLVLPDRAIRHIHYVVHPGFDAAGQAVELIGTVMDVTDRKRAEEALQESENRYRNIFETVGVAILEEDFSKAMALLGDLKARGVRDLRRYMAEHPEIARETLALVKVTDANDAAVALFGAASKQEFLDALSRLTTREVEAAWDAQLPVVAEGRRSVEEVVLTTLGGEKVHTLVTIVLPPESSGYDSVLVTVVDLSERKRAEEALRQAQAALTHVTRVATVGEVSASIAHELNQPLGAMANNANACLGLLSGAQPDLDEVRNALADIVSDAERASAIIERVRGMAKRSAPERVPVRFSDLVREVVGLAAAESASRRVAIQTDVPGDLPRVLGDRVQLQQVLLNLVVNGMDAMSGAGESDRTLEIRGLSDELEGHPAARISVQDRGIGVHAEQIDQLFEPFYTTKSHGMGLGLAISRSIIEAHGGRLWAEANPGLGATFSFALPAAAAGH